MFKFLNKGPSLQLSTASLQTKSAHCSSSRNYVLLDPIKLGVELERSCIRKRTVVTTSQVIMSKLLTKCRLIFAKTYTPLNRLKELRWRQTILDINRAHSNDDLIRASFRDCPLQRHSAMWRMDWHLTVPHHCTWRRCCYWSCVYDELQLTTKLW